MPQAVVDPEELRQFAQSLKKFNGQLRERAGAGQSARRAQRESGAIRSTRSSPTNSRRT